MKSLSNLQRLFILGCLLTIFTAQNTPRKYVDTSIADWADYGIRRFGYIAGLDNTWEMFSYAHREYYKMLFLGDKPSEKNILLKIPNQIEHDFLWYWFFNFREEKFLLNIYGKTGALDAYLQYLCRNASGGPYLRIRVHVERFEIISRSQAQERNSAWLPKDPYTMREAQCLN